MNEPGDLQVLKRYRRRYRASDTFIELFNALASLFIGVRHGTEVPPPRRVLLANYGHLGDIVMSTACISILRAALPDVKIGYLIGSWSRPVLEAHPDVAWLHVIDHWFLDRGAGNRFVKARRYWRSCRRVAGEIRNVGYDVAIDLRAYFPNALAVLYQAGIPTRIGYSRVFFAPLLTHPQRFVYRRAHESAIQADLLRVLGLSGRWFVDAPFSLPAPTEAARLEAKRFLQDVGFAETPYRVMHLGAAAAVKDWPPDHWRALVSRLVNEGRHLIFTGCGPRDARLIEQAIQGRNHCVSACDRLGWAALIEVIRDAELVYTVDTMAGHIAAAVGTPCVDIHGGMSDYRQWSPRPGPTTACVTHVVPCWPCFQYNGCAHMSCLRQLDVERVYAAGEQVVRRQG